MEHDAQIDEQVKAEDPGWVLTLGDELFTSGKIRLKPDASGNLDRLVTFLDTHSSRTILIEGHADSRGSESYKHGFSQQRADSVQSYLIEHGVDPLRIIALGKGESSPVAGNESETGRQQNRRVEVIISNPPAAPS